MDYDELEERFMPQALNQEQVFAVGTVRETFLSLAVLIDGLTPDSREKSIALTELESASHAAIKAIARHGRA